MGLYPYEGLTGLTPIVTTMGRTITLLIAELNKIYQIIGKPVSLFDKARDIID